MNVSFSMALALAAVVGPGCRDSKPSDYRASVQRTSYGVAHITADDLGSLGFGEGYAAAEDHLCTIADQVVKARGERAKHFGRGPRDQHFNSDVAVLALDLSGRARRELDANAETREWYEGYAAGVNAFISEGGAARTTAWCRQQPWVTPITATDLVARFHLTTFAGVAFANELAAARPPATPPATAASAALPAGDEPAQEAPLASNGWAIGADRSASGGGMLVANPHYPWAGSNRMWEKHLTIPGQLDVYGVSLIGIPGVLIGFNKDVAWTHTVSAGKRFTLYAVTLAQGQPTTYLYDGEPRPMTTRDVRVAVRGEDGQVAPVSHTVYFTHYGPVVNLPGFEWSTTRAVSYRDANEANDETRQTWLAMNRARSLDELERAIATGGITFINTIAASADGRALYVDSSTAPHLTEWAAAEWLRRVAADGATKAADARGLMLFDGSDSRFEWANAPEARDPGVSPFTLAPQLERRDYVFNANDSYWLPHATARIEGRSPAYGRERTPRSLRTRMNALVLDDRSPEGAAGADAKFTLDELSAAALSNRSMAAELLKDDLVRRCRATPSIVVSGRSVDLGAACTALAGFDGRVELESRGAVLWREFVRLFDAPDRLDAGPLFGTGFSPDDPVATPRGLAPATDGADGALAKLAAAVAILDQAGLPLDTPLGAVQYTEKAGERIPVHGGGGPDEGVTNVVAFAPNTTTLEPDFTLGARVPGSRTLTTKGYPISQGTSFLMALAFTAEGPRARAILTYSQSGEPGSPHFADQTRLFAKKAWRPVLFTADEIARDTALTTRTLVAPRSASR